MSNPPDKSIDFLIGRINELRRQKNAVILAHNYVLGEIQDIADFVGDSLELSIKAAESDADVIVFCGVKFMAETAKILSPSKVVLLPVPSAGCPMADMADAPGVRKLKAEHPEALTVCYVNSTAEVKAEVDVCCTSANAEAIVKSLGENKEIIFLPDRNLGQNVSNSLKRSMILWPGFCPSHQRLNAKMIQAKRALYPQAKVIVHPECLPEMVNAADAALSTGGMLRYVRESADNEFIVGTEAGILHRLQKENPTKRFYLLSEQAICPYMKMIELADVVNALENMDYQIDLPVELMDKARKPIERMIAQR